MVWDLASTQWRVEKPRTLQFQNSVTPYIGRESRKVLHRDSHCFAKEIGKKLVKKANGLISCQILNT
jgi:hypothetical protein